MQFDGVTFLVNLDVQPVANLYAQSSPHLGRNDNLSFVEDFHQHSIHLLHQRYTLLYNHLDRTSTLNRVHLTVSRGTASAVWRTFRYLVSSESLLRYIPRNDCPRLEERPSCPSRHKQEWGIMKTLKLAPLVVVCIVGSLALSALSPAQSAAKPDVYLSDIRAIRATNGWNGEPRPDLSIEDNPIRIRGKAFGKGMGVHAYSELVYRAHPQIERFTAIVGIDDEKQDDAGASVTFGVYADDKELFLSKVLTPADAPLPIDVAIPKGAKLIRLVVGDGGNGISCDHADWAEAGFITNGEPLPEEPEPIPEGFAPVFNGKDLDGWDGDPRFWSVRDGVIRGETTPEAVAPHNTFLVWRGGVLTNFVMRLKFRIRNGNSGIQYRCREFAKWRVAGYQAEVENAPGKVGFLYDEASRGWLVNVGDFMIIDENGKKEVVSQVADKKALVEAEYYKDEAWNEYVIEARGNHVTHTLNGYPTVELIDNDPKAAREGLFALQIHSGPPMLVEFKDILLRNLDIPFGEAFRIFDGKTLDGWTHSSERLRDTWSVKEGVIDNAGSPAGYIRTTADFTSYAFRLQLRHLTRGNGGVLLRMVGEDKVWPRSIEAQGMIRNLGDIWNIGAFPMQADATRTRGRHTPKLARSNERPLGEWNEYEIMLNGGDLEIVVNDLLQNTATNCWVTPGKICLQTEGAHMQYRNLVVLPIGE